MKKRLDLLVLENGNVSSREKAKALIMEGKVYVNGQKEDKPGASFDPEKITMEVRNHEMPYVSRGGFKLAKAMKVFPVDLNGRVCMDIGASTGGFTDCMLQKGAAKVYAVDVGYGQLDWKLRNDPRVICMEKMNFRYMKPEDLGNGEKPSFASVDVSFISLSKILPAALQIVESGGEMVCLIKPQFEAGREKVGKKGVVRDPKTHVEVIENVMAMASGLSFEILGLDYSPIRGPEGNIEYLLYLKTPDCPGTAADEQDMSQTDTNEINSIRIKTDNTDTDKTGEDAEDVKSYMHRMENEIHAVVAASHRELG